MKPLAVKTSGRSGVRGKAGAKQYHSISSLNTSASWNFNSQENTQITHTWERLTVKNQFQEPEHSTQTRQCRENQTDIHFNLPFLCKWVFSAHSCLGVCITQQKKSLFSA